MDYFEGQTIQASLRILNFMPFQRALMRSHHNHDFYTDE